MSYGWQYHGAGPAKPVIDWYVPIVDPIRISAAVLSFAAIASTTMAIESKIPFHPGIEPLPDYTWFVQDPVPVREVESAVVDEWVTYEPYCFTSVGGAIRNFAFPQQTGAFIATFSAKANGPNPDGAAILIGDSPSFVGSAYAIHVIFTTVGRDEILVTNGGAIENDAEFTWIAGTSHEFEVRVNLESHVCTVFVDGTLIAYNYDFLVGQGGVTDLDYWALISTGGIDTIEVCDFRVVEDNSAFEAVALYTQSQPLPFPPERPVDEGGMFAVIEPFDVDITVDNWHVQYPEPIPPAPLNQTAGVTFVELVVSVPEGPITLDKWFRPASEPYFEPYRMEHLSPAVMGAPLGANPVSDLVVQTLTTFLRTYVGNVGTKFKIQVRQTRGFPSVVLSAVSNRSAIGVVFHPRSRLLASNQNVLPDRDTYLIEFSGFHNVNSESNPLVGLATGDAGFFNTRYHMLFQFDIQAFSGQIWRSAKLRLWRTADSSPSGDLPLCQLRRCIRQDWDLTGATWNSFKAPSAPTGPTAWAQKGARHTTLDHSTANSASWIPPDNPEDEMVELPDITGLVNDALTFDGGILRLLVFYPGLLQTGGFPPRQYHSLEGLDADFRPQLHFDAY